MLLKGFKVPGPDKQIFVYDKLNDRSFPKALKSVASEIGFYDFRMGDSFASIDPSLTELESRTAPIIDRLRSSSDLASLNAKERIVLAQFVCVQTFRTKVDRERFVDLTQMLFERMAGSSKSNQQREQIVERVRTKAKGEHIEWVSSKTKEFLKYFLGRRWMLFKSQSVSPFLIADNPVTMFNERTHKNQGLSICGLATLGTSVYLPISSRLCLAMMCPSLEEDLKREMQEFEEAKLANAQKLLSNFEGKALPIMPDRLKLLNTLQVRNAGERLFSSRNDFQFVKDLIAKDPYLKFAPNLVPHIPIVGE